MQKNQGPLIYYSLFTKYSLMDDYGFSSGLVRRVGRKVLPAVPAVGTIEYFLFTSENPVQEAVAKLDFTTIATGPVARELDVSIRALCAKVVAFGLDSNIKRKYDTLALESEPFETLLELNSRKLDWDNGKLEEVLFCLMSIKSSVGILRSRKNEIGTNLHLTFVTKRILEYVERVEELLTLKTNMDAREHWERTFEEYIKYARQKDSTWSFVTRHADLVALQVVEHTSDKGEKYIAESREEYWSFFKKALLGGGIIAIFALAKIIISSFGFADLPNALFFSLNYALCFVLVKQVGGIIATKQPAMTASTIARKIDKDGTLKITSLREIVTMVKSVARSQFVSLLGNFLMALTLACVVAKILQVAGLDGVNEAIKPDYLMKNVSPSFSLWAYAAIAGFFLAFSGLISGYVDNKIVSSNIGHRIRNSTLFLKSDALATFVEKKAGTLMGNVGLGFFLGSTFLFSYLLPFAVDIRHIAFSSANVGYAIMNGFFSWPAFAWSILGVILIGVTNFLVSFAITLFLALKSRGATVRILPSLLWSLLSDFVRTPLTYFFFLKRD
jgi:site-specific recombinase